MAHRPYIPGQAVITNGDMTTTITSKVTIVQDLSMISYAYSWSGTSPVGNITVQVSNDYTQNSGGAVLNVGTWNDLPLQYNGANVTSIPVSGNTGNGFIDVGTLSGYAIRTQYVPTSGSGSLQATLNAKVM